MIAKVAPYYIGGSFSEITMRAKISLAFAGFTALIMKEAVYCYVYQRMLKLTIKEQIEQYLKERTIKQRIKDNKNFFIGIGTGIAFVGITYFVMRSTGLKEAPINKSSLISVFTFKTSQTCNQIVFPPYGDPGNVVQNVTTKLTYPSQGELARYLGVSPQLVSQYFGGKIPNLKGDQYIKLGKAGHPLAI